MIKCRSFTVIIAILGIGCHALTASDDDRQCARRNAFSPSTAQMRVAEERQFRALGFVSDGPSRCLSLVKGGFRYSIDHPEVATVGTTTGVVIARSTGVTRLIAHQRVRGIDYRGELRLQVGP
jgi:hypothetical protein